VLLDAGDRQEELMAVRYDQPSVHVEGKISEINSIAQETVLGIMDMLRDPRFCNRSQIVEFALKKFFEESKNTNS